MILFTYIEIINSLLETWTEQAAMNKAETTRHKITYSQYYNNSFRRDRGRSPINTNPELTLIDFYR